MHLKLLNNLSVSVLMLMACSITEAAPAGWAPLLEPQAAAEIMERESSIRVIRVSGDYGDGHISGSQHSPYADWRGSGENPGELRSLAHYGQLLRQLGIDQSTPVLVVHDGASLTDMGAATRVYWTLKSLGIDSVAVLNGGFQAWQRSGLPVSERQESVTATTYEPVWRDDWRITTGEVASLIESGGARLIDARPRSFFRGLRATVGKAGTISGASSLEYTDWFEADRLRPVPELIEVYAAAHGSESPLTVSFCNTGHWASINWFVISELLGVENTRLYAESIGAWSAAELPMDNRPGRSAVYLNLTVEWLDSLLGNQVTD